jgi:hypothetical protein
LEIPLFARLDLAQTPDGLKLLEYNGEAPGLVVETFGLNGAQNAGTAVDKNLRVPVGFHEFEMFGDSSVYLSHYPMSAASTRTRCCSK